MFAGTKKVGAIFISRGFVCVFYSLIIHKALERHINCNMEILIFASCVSCYDRTRYRAYNFVKDYKLVNPVGDSTRATQRLYKGG